MQNRVCSQLAVLAFSDAGRDELTSHVEYIDETHGDEASLKRRRQTLTELRTDSKDER